MGALDGKVALVAGATRGAGRAIVVSSGQLAPLYGFTDTDGTQPDCWRYVVEVQDRGLAADDTGYR
ncbi:hypothetical protein [Streptomyces sp. NBC_00400]|uniref:hypothetical protein n=1 Tax=Streptomyces sp. NBC_00400 TaxID=2975737 RepID=UPI003FA708B4